MERETRFFSKSMSVILTLTVSPTFRTSCGFSILLSAIWEMWIRPSMPGRIFANAPNVVMPTMVASHTVPTGY